MLTKKKSNQKLMTVLSFAMLQSCSALFRPPTEKQNSTMGEITPYTKIIKSLPDPKEKVVVAVYKFKDQTGQYKPSENGTNWSTAIPQGTTSILIKALEDSKWFMPIERENISDLLNERQIIRTTRQEYSASNPVLNPANSSASNTSQNNTIQSLPPLLYAGIILEGGIVSYDTNIMTGGLGARYFGIGGSSQYRQDNVTVYLRAVSTSTGKILKTVYTSKTLLFQSVTGNLFRYVDTERLLEADIGITKNEPVQLAVKEAIEKSVYSLIIEGVKDKIWDVEPSKKSKIDSIIAEYNKEEIINDNFRIDNRILDSRRGKFGIGVNAESNTIKGDYNNAVMKPGYKINAKYFINDHFNIELNFAKFELENTDIFKRKFSSTDLNLEFLLMPNDKFTPYLFGGLGYVGYSYSYFNHLKPKAQAGAGLEYLITNYLGLQAYGEYDFGFNDDWDGLVAGKRDDNILKFGLGLNFYFGKNNNSKFSKIKKN
ncbi:CsgG/HfaB family protein [Halpernia frigidisoli]|uniref:Curli production assembly/transport component CsgG n=1 Tax=Halpernia frigidisoli TaxID=1125876 RepID=A0A1I3DJQ6_9FLAO|nr:CsgG/HfaB family protein [Halpernia frigidisoli]SFH86936.1 curli production assembly/transport component CsgG [Halpernia frigidisoli]